MSTSVQVLAAQIAFCQHCQAGCLPAHIHSLPLSYTHRQILHTRHLLCHREELTFRDSFTMSKSALQSRAKTTSAKPIKPEPGTTPVLHLSSIDPAVMLNGSNNGGGKKQGFNAVGNALKLSTSIKSSSGSSGKEDIVDPPSRSIKSISSKGENPKAVCYLCPEPSYFESSALRSKHIAKLHPLGPGYWIPQCEVCVEDTRFIDSEWLNEHYVTCHPEIHKPQTTGYFGTSRTPSHSNTRRPRIADEYEADSARKADQGSHKNTTPTKERLPCEICSREGRATTLADKYGLKRHLKTVHRNAVNLQAIIDELERRDFKGRLKARRVGAQYVS